MLYSMVEHGPDQLALLRVKDRFDLHHAVIGVVPADVATLFVVLGPRILTVRLHAGVLARQLFELRRGRQAGALEEHRLVGRRRDPQDRADLGVRELAAAEGVIGGRKLAELAGDAHSVARGDRVPPDSPGEPLRA